MASLSLNRLHTLAIVLTTAAAPYLAGLYVVGTCGVLGTLAPVSAAPLPVQADAQKVTIPTEDKLKLTGTYYAPKEAKVRAPGVVLVHGPGGTRAELDALAGRLQKAGFAALTIDLRGHGESATDSLAWSSMDEETKTRTWAFASRDVKAGVDFLLEQKGVHATTVSLMGFGAGCALVARQATRDERVRDIVLIAPETEKLGSSIAKDVVELSGLPILVAVAKEDAVTAKRLAEAGNKSNASDPTLETQVTKLAVGELLADPKLAGDVGRWMKSKAMPGVASKPAH